MNLREDGEKKYKEPDVPKKISKKRQLAESGFKIDQMIKGKVEKENAEIIDMSGKEALPVLDECMYEKCEL